MGASRDFDGTNSWIDCGDLGLTAGTVCMWLVADAGAADRRLWGQGSGAASQAGAARIDGTKVQVWNGSSFVDVALSVTHTSPYHLAITFSGGTASAYVNGAAASSGSSAFNFSGVSFGLCQKFTGAFGNRFDGKVGHFQVYNRALTLAEIQEVMWRPDALTHSGDLKIWLPLWGDILDYSGNGQSTTDNSSADSAYGFPVSIGSPRLASVNPPAASGAVPHNWKYGATAGPLRRVVL